MFVELQNDMGNTEQSLPRFVQVKRENLWSCSTPIQNVR